MREPETCHTMVSICRSWQHWGRRGGDVPEGKAHVCGSIEAFVDDGVVPLELEQDPQDRPGDATAGDDDLRSRHSGAFRPLAYGGY